MVRKEEICWIPKKDLKTHSTKQRKKSVYEKVKEILQKNKDRAYTRNGLVKEIDPNLKDETKEIGNMYWQVAHALTFFEDDGFVEAERGGNPVYYYWKD